MAKFGPVVEGLEVGQAYKLVVPQKLPLGGKVQGKRQPGLFRVFVPSRDGGTLTIETSGGSVEVLDPAGAPAKDAAGKAVAKAKKVTFDVPVGTHGWFGVVVTGSASYEVSSTFVIEGHARDKDGSKLVPWHFWYFPFTDVNDAHPAKKWHDRFKTGAFAFEKESFWKSEIASGGRTRGGFEGHTINQAAVDAYNKFLGRDAIKLADCGWWGHCDAAAVASAIFTQPKPTGGFTEQDLEWAATEIAMRGYGLELKFFLGGLGNSSRNHVSHKEVPKDQEGQSIDKDIGPFHEALVNVLRNEGAAVIMDFRADFRSETDDRHSHVWNQCVYKFRAEATQAEEDGPGKDEEALARKVAFKTTVFANADQQDSSGTPESPAGSGWDRELEYVLHFDAKGKVDATHAKNNVKKCSWKRTGKDYFMPRYIFKVKGLAGSGGNGNPHVSIEHLETLGVGLRPAYKR